MALNKKNKEGCQRKLLQKSTKKLLEKGMTEVHKKDINTGGRDKIIQNFLASKDRKSQNKSRTPILFKN